MLRTYACLPLLLTALLLMGCAKIVIDVPSGSDVRLLPPDEEATVEIEHQVWFALWGFYPLGESGTAALIEEHQLSEARFVTGQSGIDAILTGLTSIVGFQRRQVIVEGNRRVGSRPVPKGEPGGAQP